MFYIYDKLLQKTDSDPYLLVQVRFINSTPMQQAITSQCREYLPLPLEKYTVIVPEQCL